ncbi:MAG: acylphosphatase [Candidatus Zixiibacteriota bacterium]
MNDVGAEIRVRGQVQGVGYRHFVWTRANEIGLTGRVRNLSDGSVSIMAEGDRTLIETLIQELKVGPYSAIVSDVNVRWTKFTGNFHRFDITR